MLDAWALRNSQWRKRAAAWLYEGRHLQGAACLHALNTAEAQAIRAFGLRSPICIIRNGVDLPVDVPLRRPQRPRTLLYLGRLHPKKGLANLIEAWSLVRQDADESDWCLLIAGWDQNGHRSQLETLCRKLQLGNRARFAGPQFGADKNGCFNTASAFVLPSLSEGLPMAVLEAWAWRLPVLMTPQCNLSEGFTAGAAFSMEPKPESIESCLRRLFALSDSERSAMGEQGRALVERRFAWPSIASQMAAVYDWVLGGSLPSTVEIWS
jgi:poly(glycerol-phosphate) alpha-glucosyltransferase